MKKADFILIAVVLVVSGVMLFFLYGVNDSDGGYAQIEVDGEVVETLPLDENTTYEILTDDDGINVLTIEDGYAVMTEANCPNGTCTNHKKISLNGESIICLPHKIVVTIINENENEIDAVA